MSKVRSAALDCETAAVVFAGGACTNESGRKKSKARSLQLKMVENFTKTSFDISIVVILCQKRRFAAKLCSVEIFGRMTPYDVRINLRP